MAGWSGAALTAEPKRPGRGVAFALIGVGLLGIVFAGAQEVARLRGVSEAKSRPASEFSLPRWDGGTQTLSALRGKVVLLDFWATWCPPCVEEMPSLVKLAKEYASQGVVLVAASRDEPATWKVDVSLFADKRAPGLTAQAVLADDAVSDRYNVSVLPTLFFIDREGKIVAESTGYTSEDALRARLERVLKESK